MQPLLPTDPHQVGPYRLSSRLGSGGMGNVYLGHSRAGRAVAVKVVKPEIADVQGFRERFRREVGLAMRVGGFWTAAVVDADPDCATPWVASQHVEGPSLSSVVAESGPLDEETVRFLGTGLAEALVAFHCDGLVHRDLKPSNILLAHDGPRVIDFGISKSMDGSTSLTVTGAVMGTPGFLSPEQATGTPVGTASDIFAFGSLLTFASTGNGPFGHGPAYTLLYRVVHDEPDVSAVPRALHPLVAACLDKEPERRPTARQLLDLLDLSRLGVADGPPSGWPAPQAARIARQRQREPEEELLYQTPAPQKNPPQVEPYVRPLVAGVPPAQDRKGGRHRAAPPVEAVSTPPPKAPFSRPAGAPPDKPPLGVHETEPPAPDPAVPWNEVVAAWPTNEPEEDRERATGPDAVSGGGRKVVLQRLVPASLLALATFAACMLAFPEDKGKGVLLGCLCAAVCLALGLRSVWPYLHGGLLHIDAEGIRAQRADVILHLSWDEVTLISFRRIGRFSLSVVAGLRDGVSQVPPQMRFTDPLGPYHFSWLMLCRSQPERAANAQNLHEVLSRHAGDTYRPDPGFRPRPSAATDT